MIKEKVLKSMFVKLFISLIIIVVVLTAYADTVPLLQAAGNNINNTGIALGSMFAPRNIVMIIIMLSLALMIIINMLRKVK